METVNNTENNKKAPMYATAIVYYQRQNEDLFEPDEALSKGTIFPSLYMPYTYWRFKK